jgi:hypothetical protein
MAYSMTQWRTAWVAASAALAWLGFYIHNVADLPGQTLLSPETSLPRGLACAGLLAGVGYVVTVAGFLLGGYQNPVF